MRIIILINNSKYIKTACSLQISVYLSKHCFKMWKLCNKIKKRNLYRTRFKSALTREVSLWYVRIVVPSFAITVVIRRSNGCYYQKTCSMYLAAFKENECSDVYSDVEWVIRCTMTLLFTFIAYYHITFYWLYGPRWILILAFREVLSRFLNLNASDWPLR